jgi:diguanylate cyclase (GGDEF)-like protein
MRIVFSVLLILFLYIIRKFKHFETYSLILSALELTGVAIFLFVLSSYPKPDFSIQSMGMTVIIIGIFLFPNKWRNMLTVSIISVTAFLIVSNRLIPDLDGMGFAAGSIYVIIITVLCAIGARTTERYQIREYLSLEDLRIISTTDNLTKACNRYRLEQESKKWMYRCRVKGRPLSLAFIDVDDLKVINDIHGHLIGDQILIEIVARMRKCLRDNDLIARWGGDELAILLPETDIHTAVRIMEKIRDKITVDIFPGGVTTSCSFGVTQMDSDSTFLSLLYVADQMMYEGKKKGKNRIEVRS